MAIGTPFSAMSKTNPVSRRDFLRRGIVLAAGVPVALRASQLALLAEDTGPAQAVRRTGAAVAIVPCRSYGPEVRAALDRGFDLLGGLGALVKNKTVTVKINLTGTDFAALNFPPFNNLPVG